MRRHFDKGRRDAIEALIARANIMSAGILSLPDVPQAAADPALATARIAEMNKDFETTTRRLFALLAASPLLTESWLAENPDKWGLQDLFPLVNRYKARYMKGRRYHG
jgi:hypothetical protein